MARPALVTRVVIPSGPCSIVRDYHRALEAGFTCNSAKEAIRARNAHFDSPIKVLHAKQRTKARAAITYLKSLQGN